MTKVTLLGDSIRQGYQDVVREKLRGEAVVWAPKENCMHSLHHICNLGWYLDQPADIIHFNFGLWDCRRLGFGQGENILPIELFVRNLDFLLVILRARSDAAVIWANITPVIGKRYARYFSRRSDPVREEGDIALYNAAALPVLAKHQVTVNDLHRFVLEQGPNEILSEDGVHFTTQGCTLLGERVASCIRNALAKSE